MRRAKRAIALTVASLAACGDDGTSTSSSSSGGSSGASASSTSGGSTSSSSSGSSGGAAGATCGPDAGACASGLVCCAPRPDLDGVCQAKACELDSDREIKEDFASVDRAALLEKIVGLPIEEWTYVRDRREGVRHVGPMAQDFSRAFGLGASERHIHAIDAHGVTFAAIQALHDRILALEGELTTLRRQPKKPQKVAAKKPRGQRRAVSAARSRSRSSQRNPG